MISNLPPYSLFPPRTPFLAEAMEELAVSADSNGTAEMAAYLRADDIRSGARELDNVLWNEREAISECVMRVTAAFYARGAQKDTLMTVDNVRTFTHGRLTALESKFAGAIHYDTSPSVASYGDNSHVDMALVLSIGAVDVCEVSYLLPGVADTTLPPSLAMRSSLGIVVWMGGICAWHPSPYTTSLLDIGQSVSTIYGRWGTPQWVVRVKDLPDVVYPIDIMGTKAARRAYNREVV
jgi:hypothetical protein